MKDKKMKVKYHFTPIEYVYYVDIKSISKDDEDNYPEIVCSLVFKTEEDAEEYGRKSCKIFEGKDPSLVYDYD